MAQDRAEWDEVCYFIAVIDGGFDCDDDQAGVVINAAVQDALRYNE